MQQLLLQIADYHTPVFCGRSYYLGFQAAALKAATPQLQRKHNLDAEHSIINCSAKIAVYVANNSKNPTNNLLATIMNFYYCSLTVLILIEDTCL